jgi:hypothetical protein
MFWELALTGADMTPKHVLKLSATILVLFLGFQFGRDIATKVSTSTTTSTPASS